MKSLCLQVQTGIREDQTRGETSEMTVEILVERSVEVGRAKGRDIGDREMFPLCG